MYIYIKFCRAVYKIEITPWKMRANYFYSHVAKHKNERVSADYECNLSRVNYFFQENKTYKKNTFGVKRTAF